MAFSGNDTQTTNRFHELMVFSPLSAQINDSIFLSRFIQRIVGLHRINRHLQITAQHNIGTATRHIGGNGDHLRTSSLCHDFRFTCMLLGVQHLVRQVLFFQQLIDDFRIFNRCCPNQNRLPTFITFANIFHCSFVFFTCRFVDAIQLIFTLARAVWWHHQGL